MSNRSFLRKFFSRSSGNGQHSNKHTLQELCIYFLFLTVTTIITLSAREIGMFYFNDTVNRLFLQRSSEKEEKETLEFDDLVTLDDWWTFVETTFIEGIASFEGSNSSLGLVVGGNILLGAPRIRQIRVKNESCNVDETFKNYFTTCYGPYSESKEDTNKYLGKNHYDQSELNSYSLWGSIAEYSGGGYIQRLTNDKERNEKILAQLKEEIWIDSATRIVLLEFSLFNANVNLFCNAKLIAEIPATGGMITSSHLQSLKFYPLWNSDDNFVIICFIVFVGLIVYFTLEKIRDIIVFGYTASIGSFFKMSSIAILLISYFSIAYIIWHEGYIKSLLKKYSENKEDYLSLDIICYWNLMFIDAIGVSVFIVWIQVFKYVEFNKTMLQFSTTLQRCAKDLLGFSIMFAIVLIAYAYLSILFFGSALSDFQDFSSAFLTLMRMVLGDFDYERLEEANRVLGPIFFLTFILFVFLILMNMFLAIINETYTDVKSDTPTEKVNQFEEYINSILSKLKNLILPQKKKKSNENVPIKKAKRVRLRSPRRARQKPKPPEEIKYKTRKEALESVFEIIPVMREGDLLNERVIKLEKKVEKLIKHMDLILDLTKPTKTNISNRSL